MSTGELLARNFGSLNYISLLCFSLYFILLKCRTEITSFEGFVKFLFCFKSFLQYYKYVGALHKKIPNLFGSSATSFENKTFQLRVRPQRQQPSEEPKLL